MAGMLLWQSHECHMIITQLIIHTARTQKERSRNPCHYDIIKEVAKTLSIQVIAKWGAPHYWLSFKTFTVSPHVHILSNDQIQNDYCLACTVLVWSAEMDWFLTTVVGLPTLATTKILRLLRKQQVSLFCRSSWSLSSGNLWMSLAGCDSAMIARAAQWNPSVFRSVAVVIDRMIVHHRTCDHHMGHMIRCNFNLWRTKVVL